jgi:uncharacterized protein (TIGR00290 family)
MVSVRRPKAWLSWSTGKDSAYALWEARRQGEVEIVGVLTTVTQDYDRVSMHGVREELLDRQIAELDLPCHKVSIPPDCSNDVYDARMATAMVKAREAGVTHVVFGDLFLEEIRNYRESRLASAGFEGVFPLWLRDTRALAQAMLDAGFSATLTCVDPRQLAPSFAGRLFDAKLLAELPPRVDPCGENGEFHTFVTHAPVFGKPIDVRVGDVVEREGFVFADLLPI